MQIEFVASHEGEQRLILRDESALSLKAYLHR